MRQHKFPVSSFQFRKNCKSSIQFLSPACTLFTLSFLLTLPTGCHQVSGMVDAALEPATRLSTTPPIGFWPTEVSVLPLTRLTHSVNKQASPYLHLFVGLQDRHRCYTKSPGVFRLKLHERIPRSAQAKGQVISEWPDIDLVDPEKNQLYWRDYLRCYEFRLDLIPGTENLNGAILEVTFLAANEQRLTTQYTVTFTEP